MASLSESEFGAGGKIVSNRRKKRPAATPYDRSPQPSSSAKSPSWFSGVILPSARAIASGAGKILSSVLYSDSSSSEGEDGSDSENDVENGNDDKAPSRGNIELNKGTSVDMMQLGHGSDSRARKNEAKHIIEQLIMGEMFSREECDRLIKIINSRVVDFSTMEGGEKNLALSPGRTVGNANADLSNRAVMEAQKWLEEKKVRSSPGLDLAHGTCGCNAIMLENTESTVGSPVDMAKSYMKARPPWASPTKQIELRTPSTMKMEPYKEGALYSVGNDSLSSLKKRNSLASGSWNIQEELRKVRSKATDDMLHSLSSKIDLSLPPKSSLEHLRADILAASMREKKSELGSSPVAKSIDASPNLEAVARSNQGLSALDSRKDGGVNETLPSKPTTFVTGQNEDSEAIWTDGECTSSKPPCSTTPNHVEEHHEGPHASVNGATNREAEFGGNQSSDGHQLSPTRLSAQVGEGDDVPTDKENGDGTANQKNLTNAYPVEDKCEFLSEAYIDVPVLTDINTGPTGSQNSFSLQHEEYSPELTLPAKNNELGEKVDGVVGKQPGRKYVKNSRRGRGRGK